MIGRFKLLICLKKSKGTNASTTTDIDGMNKIFNLQKAFFIDFMAYLLYAPESSQQEDSSTD